jgi:hypothetical protein
MHFYTFLWHTALIPHVFKGRDMEPVGYTWLVERFALTKSPITHQSYLGIRSQLNISASIDRTIEIFQKNYDPGDDPLAHVAFAL